MEPMDLGVGWAGVSLEVTAERRLERWLHWELLERVELVLEGVAVVVGVEAHDVLVDHLEIAAVLEGWGT